MGRLALVLALLFSTFGRLQAQEVDVSGSVVDTSNAPLAYASVVLLQAEDSVIQQFGITNAEGTFSFAKVPQGQYILQCSFIGYQEYSKALEVQGKKEFDAGNIVMKPSVQSLDEIVVEENIVPIRIKGDTVEYNANAFETQPNAAVEDLLKKLPGVQVDKDGNIKAQGEEVKKVYVDGKEFFGDDPKIATKNLPADAIEKVQVYDKQSDNAAFTGVDDGIREKSINLQLKEDKKNGLFGKIEGGYGTNDRYRTKANINRFDKKTQISALGMANNVNEQGFSIEDYINFMGGIQKLMESGGAQLGGDGFQLQIPGANSGISTNLGSGINYNRDLSKKTQLFSNYFFNGVNSKVVDQIDRTTFYQNRTTDEDILNNRSSKSYNHRLNVDVKSKIDSANELRIEASGSFNQGSISRLSQQELSDNLGLQNSAWSQNSAESMGYTTDIDVTHRHRFAKPGRSSVLSSGFNLSKNTGDGEVFLQSQQSAGGNLQSTLINDQYNTNDQSEQAYQASYRYTEPLGKKNYLTAVVSGNLNDKLSERQFFNAETNQFIDSLSRQFTNRFAYATAGLAWKKNKESNSFTIGLNVQASELTGKAKQLGEPVVKQFNNLLPYLSWRINPKKGKYINVYYQTQVNAPTIDQLQPIVDNADPLRIYQGNPNLDQEYQHSLSLNMMRYNQFAFSSWHARINATYVDNKIINQVSISPNFVRLTQPINTDENFTLNTNLGYSKEIKKITFELEGSSAYTRGLLFTENIASTTQNFIQSVDVNVGNRKKEKADITIGGRITENRMVYDDNLKLNNTGYEYLIFADVRFSLKKKWFVAASYDYTIYNNNVLNNQSFPMVRASLSRYLLKNDRGELKLSVFDALNQNQGINYTNQLNYTENRQSNVLNRYVMLTFVYSLSKFGEKGFELKGRRGR